MQWTRPPQYLEHVHLSPPVKSKSSGERLFLTKLKTVTPYTDAEKAETDAGNKV